VVLQATVCVIDALSRFRFAFASALLSRPFLSPQGHSSSNKMDSKAAPFLESTVETRQTQFGGA
jgi:hypothetical protein